MSLIGDSRLFLVSPIRDEIHNIKRLIDSVQKQSVEIHCWVIIENDSTDGSQEYLEKIQFVNNVEQVVIKNISFKDKEYSIGYKYSHIVQYGFTYLKENFKLRNSDFLALLDGDCAPEKNYFSKLINVLQSDKKLGLVSGIQIFNDGSRDKLSDYTVRGPSRVWKYECFSESGKHYGLAPDRTTQIKAELMGWKTAVVDNAYLHTRKVNSRVSHTFRGKADYYNGYTLLFAILKTSYLVFRDIKTTVPYLAGYVEYMVKRKDKNPDQQILKYNKSDLRRVSKRVVQRLLKNSGQS